MHMNLKKSAFESKIFWPTACLITGEMKQIILVAGCKGSKGATDLGMLHPICSWFSCLALMQAVMTSFLLAKVRSRSSTPFSPYNFLKARSAGLPSLFIEIMCAIPFNETGHLALPGLSTPGKAHFTTRPCPYLVDRDSTNSVISSPDSPTMAVGQETMRTNVRVFPWSQLGFGEHSYDHNLSSRKQIG